MTEEIGRICGDFTERKKVTIHDLGRKVERGERLTMLTAYDFPTATLIDREGIDIILVGDSLAMAALGYESTVQVSMEEMIHHAKAVKRGTLHALLIGDMPFLSYQVSAEEAVRNAGRFLHEAGCDAVKLEGGLEVIDKIQAILNAGIAVMGHLGLTPQSAGKLGGYRVQGREASQAQAIKESAKRLEEIGCFALVLECVPASLAKEIAEELKIPVIGIGAGRACDGQVLVTNDLLGLFERFTPKFVKQYTLLNREISKAIRQFKAEVETGKFPDQAHSY